MKLIELSPRWISPDVFVFLCPHCRVWMLSCKRVEMPMSAQFDLFEKVFGQDWNGLVVPMNESTIWSISIDDFAQMSVSPSIDASASGHWHGHITCGDVVP